MAFLVRFVLRLVLAVSAGILRQVMGSLKDWGDCPGCNLQAKPWYTWRIDFRYLHFSLPASAVWGMAVTWLIAARRGREWLHLIGAPLGLLWPAFVLHAFFHMARYGI